MDTRCLAVPESILVAMKLQNKFYSSYIDEVDLHLQHIWSDVELDPISRPRQSSYSLGALKDKEYKPVAMLPEEKGS